MCEAIAEHPAWPTTTPGVPKVVAVVTDGTAVLGLGDIGPAAALPVMEGKAMLFKQFGGVDAVPIALATTDMDEIIETVARLAPSFGGVNLEDISAPRCFEIERRLQERLDIPVFHDDQHGTAVVTLAALATPRADRSRPGDARVVISGAGAAGVAIAKFLLEAGLGDVAVADRKGVLNRGVRPDARQARARGDHRRHLRPVRSLATRMAGADVFIGVSGGTVPEEAVASMAPGRSSSGWPTRTPRSTPMSRTSTRRGGDRALRLPEPDQQRARVPRHLPGRLRCGPPGSPRA